MTQDGFYAVRCGNAGLLKKLLDEGNVKLTTARWSGVTLLHRAAGERAAPEVNSDVTTGSPPQARRRSNASGFSVASAPIWPPRRFGAGTRRCTSRWAPRRCEKIKLRGAFIFARRVEWARS